MKRDFRTASLIDMKLPASQKERLWRSGLVANPALMDTLSCLSQEWITTEEEAATYVDEAFLAEKLIKKYAVDFFPGKIPAEVYYAALSRIPIEYEPHSFPNLPDNYSWLSKQLHDIEKNPDNLSYRGYSPQAKFCHMLEKFVQLQRFRYALRSGSVVAGQEISQTVYNSVVPHVKADFPEGPAISRDARHLTQDIDHIVNNYNDEYAWYIKTAAQNGEKVFENDFVFSETGLPDYPYIRHVFNFVYDSYKNKNEDGFSAYYQFSEEVLMPLSLLAHGEIEESTVVYSLTHRTRSERKNSKAASLLNDNQMEHFPHFNHSDHLYHILNINPDPDFINSDWAISKEAVHAVKSSIIFSDLIYQTMKISTSKTKPYIFMDQLDHLYQRLKSTNHLVVGGMPISELLLEYRNLASLSYNAIVEANPKLSIPAYAPPGPAQP